MRRAGAHQGHRIERFGPPRQALRRLLREVRPQVFRSVYSVDIPYERKWWGLATLQGIDITGVPYRIRTGVAAVREGAKGTFRNDDEQPWPLKRLIYRLFLFTIIRDCLGTSMRGSKRLATVHTPEGMPLPPTALAELQRDMARLGFVVSQIREIEEARQNRLEQQPETGPRAMVRLLARVVGIGIETADMLVNEVLSRPMRDRRAVARYAGLTGAPDESCAQRREQGLARSGNAGVRRGMIQLAWRFLRFQKQSALADSSHQRTQLFAGVVAFETIC